MVERARMTSKACLHQRDHVLRHAVGRKAGGWGHGARAFGTKTFAVLGVIVPLAPDGLFTGHQNAVTLAHLAVKELHAQLFFVACPFGKLGAAAQKVCVAYPAQQHLSLPGSVFDQPLHAPGPGFHHHQCFGWVLAQGQSQAARKVRGQLGVVHLHIGTRPAAAVRNVCKMPHARQEDRDPGLVVPDFARFAVGLDHQKPVLGGVKVGQGRVVPAELVAQNQNQVSAS